MREDKIGRYQLRGALGQGGMATVYRAFDPKIQREVAIKIMGQELLTNDILRSRFEREAETVAKLAHPHIVPVYDFGEHKQQPYLVMRLMSGGTLSERLLNGGLSFEETLRIFWPLAAALDVAHQFGIVHRDLKPGNILFDQFDIPFLADFGIARLNQDGATLTTTDILGTPHYMSPEQAEAGLKVDHRSDIYALGVMLYECLTGQRPFTADTPIQIIYQHISAPPPSASHQNKALSRGVDEVLKKALAKEPTARYESATELVEALATAINAPATVKHGGSRLVWLIWLVPLLLLLGAGGWLAAMGFMDDDGAVGGSVAVVETATQTATLPPAPTSLPTETPTVPPTATPQSTSTLMPSSTPQPTTTAVLTPLPAPTSQPQLITAANLNQLKLLQAFSLSGPVLDVVTSPDEQLVAVLSSSQLDIYDAVSLVRLHRLSLAGSNQLGTLQWSADGSYVAAATSQRGLVVWSPDRPTRVERLLESVPRGALIAPVWSPDGRYLAWYGGSASERIGIWDSQNEWVREVLTGHEGRLTALAWSPQADRLASGAEDNSVRLWTVAGEETHLLQQRAELAGGQGADIFTLVWSPDGRKVTAQTSPPDLNLVMWDAESGVNELELLNVSHRHFVADGILLLLRGLNLELWNVADSQKLATLGAADRSVRQMVLSPDGQQVLLNTGFSVLVFPTFGDNQTGAPPLDSLRFADLPEGLREASWVESEVGEAFLLTTGEEETVLWSWDGNEAAVVERVAGHHGLQTAVLLRNKSLITVGAWDNLIRLHPVADGTAPPAFVADYLAFDQRRDVRVVAWSADSQYVAALYGDEVVRVWSAATGEIIHAFSDHQVRDSRGTLLPVNHVAWSTANDFHLATAGSDGMVYLYDIRTGARVAELAHRSPVYFAAWSPSGDRLATLFGERMNSIVTVSFWEGERFDALDERYSGRNVHEVVGIIWSQDESLYSLGGSSGGFNSVVRTAEGHNEQFVFGVHIPSGIFAWAFSPDSNWLVMAGRGDNALSLWNMADLTERVFRNSQSAGSGVLSLDWSPDGLLLGGVERNGQMGFWQIEDNALTQVRRFPGYNGRLFVLIPDADRIEESDLLGYTRFGFDWSPDGRAIVAVNRDNNIHILGVD